MDYKNDIVILAALKQRDRNAFIYLYKNYTRPIKYFVKTNGGNDTDAEEIEQNVIVILYEKITFGNFVLHEGTKLSTYMFAVGKKMWYKKSNREIKFSPEDKIVDSIDHFDDEVFSEINGLEDEVVKALNDTDDDCKKILTAFYYDKKSMREIADNLGTITEENLRKRKYKCLQKLKKVLTDKIQNNG